MKPTSLSKMLSFDDLVQVSAAFCKSWGNFYRKKLLGRTLYKKYSE